MATQYSNKPIVTDGLVYALDFGNPKSYVSGSTTANSLLYNPTPARFSTVPAGDYDGLAAAYSVRKVVSSYTGSAMQVQSASATLDIGFDADGNLDTGSIATFAGSGDAFVKIWYDQSGNNNHATQSVVASQPKIYSGSQGSVVLENNKPAIYFDGSNDFLQVSQNLFSGTSAFSNFLVGKLYNNTGYNRILSEEVSGVGNRYYTFVMDATGTKVAGEIDFTTKFSFPTSSNINNTQKLFGHLLYSGNHDIVINSVVEATDSNVGSVKTNTALFRIGTTSHSNTLNTRGNFQEIVLYRTNQTSNRLKIEDNITNYYQIFTSSYNPTPDLNNTFLGFKSDSGNLNTNQSFPGFSYDRGNSTVMYVGETKGNSSVFTQDTNLSVVATTSSVGFGSTSNNIGRTYPVSGLKHVTLRFSSGSVDCFVNGLPVPANSVFPTGSSVAGGKFAIPVYTGSLGLVQVYNRPLTGDEIWNNYQLTAPRFNLGPLENKPYTLDENAYLFLSQSAITDPIITSSIDTFVRGLKQNNLWDKMIAIYPFVGTGSAGVNLTGSQLWNLKEPSLVTYPLSFTGSWIGSTSGSAPSGNNTNISTQVTPSTYYPFYNTQSAHISILSYDTPVSSSYLMGTGMTEELAVSTLAGDYGTPAAAYSVRKVRTAYSGALMDVRRSLDNVTASIGYVESGDLDTGSLLNFVKTEGDNYLPGAYDGLAAAYSLRKVSASYSGPAIQATNHLIYKDIGFDAEGNLDTGSLTPLVATGSNIPLDSYSGLAAAYSLRKVVPSYLGDAIEVQSGSVSQSIGFDSLGNLDTTSLLSFAGSGDAYVKTWYDQSGNNNHATQSVAASQPQIVDNGSILLENNKPYLDSDGVNDRFTIAPLTLSGDYTIAIVSALKDFSTNMWLGTSGLSGYIWVVDGESTGFRVRHDGETGGANFSGVKTLNQELHLFQRSGTTMSHSRNSVNTTTTERATQGVNFTIDLLLDGYQPSSGYAINAKTQEILIYSSSQAANRTYIENNINAYYGIYTTSSTSTENAFVSTWYDQSGNNRHATQTATGSQPLIVSSGSLVTENGKPALSFDGVDDELRFNTFSANEFAFFATYKPVDPTTESTVLSGGDNSSDRFDFGVRQPTDYRIFVGSDSTSTRIFSSVDYMDTYGLFVGTHDELRANNTTVSTGDITNIIKSYNSQNSIGTRRFSSTVVYGESNIQELLLYTSSQSSNRPLIENNINNYYQIYTGSNHGFVARWYDQSGNNRHAVQTLTGSQPIIVESGSVLLKNNKPSLDFDGTNDNLIFSGNFMGGSAGSGFSVSSFDNNTRTSREIIYGLQDTTGFRYDFLITRQASNASTGFLNNGLDFYVEGDHQANISQTITDTNQHIFSAIYSNNVRRVLYDNGSAIGNYTNTNLGNLDDGTDFLIGSDINSSSYIDGKIQEIIMYTSNQSSNREPIEYGINNYYNIYPQTSSFTTSSFTIKADPTSISGSINNKLTSGIASSGPLGLITVSRTGSDSLTLARNGAVTSFNTAASGALSTGIYLGAINNNGLALGNSPLNLSFASVGTGLTGADITNLSTLISNFKLKFMYPEIVTDGLVSYLDAGNIRSYPTSGSTWNDLTYAGVDGTLTGSADIPSYSSLNGGSIVFDRSDKWVNLPYISSLDLTSQGTLSIWCYLNTVSQEQYAGLIGMTTGGTAGEQSYYINFLSNNNTLSGAIANNGVYNTISIPRPTSIGWYNFVFTWNGTVLKFYENNIQKTPPVSQTINAQSLKSDIKIGGRMFYPDAPGSGEFDGRIAISQIYNRALTDTEVLQNFNATRGRFGI